MTINQSSITLNGKKIINVDNIQYKIQDKKIRLKNEEYFVVGENYNKSVDSRNYGPITKNQIIGKVMSR